MQNKEHIISERKIDVKKFLPHRGSMLMVDRLVYFTADEVKTAFAVTSDCIFVQNGKLSESGIIEHMAQTCSINTGSRYFADSDLEENDAKVLGFISSIKKASIYRLPILGETIETKSTEISRFETSTYMLTTMKGEVKVADEIIAKAEMALYLHKNV